MKVLYESGMCFTRAQHSVLSKKQGYFLSINLLLIYQDRKITETFEDPAQELASQSGLSI